MKTSIKATLTDLWQFIKRPNDKQIDLTFAHKLRFFAIILSTEILFTFLIIVPLLYMVDIILPLQDNFFEEDSTLVEIFVFLVLILPIGEEVVFRFFLRYRKMYHRLFTKRSWDRIFPYLVYCGTLLFGAIHITNFDNTSIWLYVLAPVIVLSQAFSGLVIAFLRVRLSFIWGIIYHMVWNFIFCIIASLAYISYLGEYIQNNDNYSLAVQPQAFYESDKPQGIEISETTDGTITNLEIEQHTLNFVVQQVYGEGKYYAHDDIFVNMHLDSEEGISKQELLKVLQEEYDIRTWQDTAE